MSLAIKTKAFVAAVVLVGSGSLALARMQAGDERSIPYQGVLEENGVAKNGPVTLRFSLFAGVAGGEPLWTEDQAVDVSAGRFSAVLGDGDGDVLSDEILSNPALFLEVAVLDDTTVTTLSPRQEIVPVPLAARAANADRAASVVDKSVTRASLADDVRFAATITVPSPGTYTITRQVPANWIQGVVRNSGSIPGDVFIFATGAASDVCVVSPLVGGVVMGVEVVPGFGGGLPRVRTQNLAGAAVDASFSIICERT